MSETANFWDKSAEKYAKAPIADMESYTYTLERTRSYLAANDRVLEVGCGTGSTALELASGVAEIVATDISQEMIRIARQKADDAGVKNITFRASAVAEVPDHKEPFDAVLGHNVFHLVEDLPEALRTLHSHLKPGGIFISKTFCIDPGRVSAKIRLMRAILPFMQMIGKAPWVAFMTSNELETAFTDAGYQIIETGNYPADEPRRYIVARKPL